MKLLLDANLSWRLVKRLQSDFPETIHVNQTGLPQPAVDSQIWDFAKAHNYTIVTNDEDYLKLSLSKGFPPKVILLRLGNLSTLFCLNIIISNKKLIELLGNSEEVGIIEIA